MVSKLTSTAFLLLQIPVEVFYLWQFVIFIAMLFSSANLNPSPSKRIVSLVPSQTELLYYLGLDEEVIAITKFCIHPNKWYRNKLRVGGTKDIEIEKIKKLKPDLIIANKEENVRQQVEALSISCPVLVTDVNNYAEALQMIIDVGSLVNRTNEAAALVHQLEQSFRHKKQSPPEPIRACYLIWKDPYMTVGHDTFIHDMMGHAGFINVFAVRTRYPVVTIQEILTSGCQVVLLSSEPYPFKEKHLAEFAGLLPGKRIMLVDGEMFSWYGSRLLLAPDYFHALRQGIRPSSF